MAVKSMLGRFSVFAFAVNNIAGAAMLRPSAKIRAAIV